MRHMLNALSSLTEIVEGLDPGQNVRIGDIREALKEANKDMTQAEAFER
jgi:hypothetical protein